MSTVLGVSAYGSDRDAAVVLVDGAPAACVEEARSAPWSTPRGLPVTLLERCLSEAGIARGEIDFIAFSGKPLLRLEASLEAHLRKAPRDPGAFIKASSGWLANQRPLVRQLREWIDHDPPQRPVFCESHEALAASAFFTSPYDEAAFLVLDASGEPVTRSFGIGHGRVLEVSYEGRWRHSLGALEDCLAEYCGFTPSLRTPVMMDLAAEGEPRYRDRIFGELVALETDASLVPDRRWHDPGEAHRMRDRLTLLLGAPPREPGSPIREVDRDLAASWQAVLQEILLACAGHVARQTGLRRLCLAGRMATNDRAVSLLRTTGPFESVWTGPETGPVAEAFGAALFVWHQLLGRERSRPGAASPRRDLRGVPSALEGAPPAVGITREELETDEKLVERVASGLAAGRVVGWYPATALLEASPSRRPWILCDARQPAVSARLNQDVRRCDEFRSFTLLTLAGSQPGALPTRPVVSRTLELDDEHEPLARILAALRAMTGRAEVLAADFWLEGEPAVRTREEALRAFLSSGMDVLCLGRALFSKPPGGGSLAFEDPLASPCCGASLTRREASLHCARCDRGFVGGGGVPQLLWPETGAMDGLTRSVKAFYEETPFPAYQRHDSPRSLRARARIGRYARALDDSIPFGSRVLEVGCGTGQLSNFLGMGWRQVLGVDMSLASLRLAEGFRSSHGLDRVQFAQMNLFHAALAPESFDVVICHGVLHSTPAPRSGLEALLRLLRPGGHVVLGLYNRFGRKPTRLRRALIGLGGDRLAWIDPFLRGPDWSEARRRAWLRDQYRHPLESSHTFDEVLGWLDASGIVFVRGIPAFAPGTDPLEGPTLFASDGRGSRFDRLVAQLGLIATGHREGGYFVVIGRKPDARTSERLASPAPASTLGPRRSSHLRRYLGLVTSPLQRLSSLAFLAVVYYLVLTPIAFGRRLVDLLGASGRGSRLEPGWTTRQARNEVASHFLRF